MQAGTRRTDEDKGIARQVLQRHGFGPAASRHWVLTWQGYDHRLLLERYHHNSVCMDLPRTHERNIHLVIVKARNDLVAHPSSSTSDTMGKASRNARMALGTRGLKGAVGVMPTH